MRARITVTDLLWYTVAIAAIWGLYPVYSSFLASNSGVIPGGVMVLLQTVMPTAVVVLLSVIFAKAAVGPGGQ